MKSIKQNFKKWPVIIGAVCLVAAGLSSCVKNHDNTPAKPTSGLAFVDACPDAAAIDFYLSGQQVNLSPVGPGNYFNYFNAYAGKVQATFYQAGSTTLIGKDSINLVANHGYTLFMANVAANPDFILTQDSLSAPANGKITVRLVNASPDAGAIELIVKGSTSPIVSAANYKSVSVFAPATVNITDSLQVRQSGSSNILATVPASHFQNGSVFTVWLYGLANTTTATQKLKAGIMQNGYFSQ